MGSGGRPPTPGGGGVELTWAGPVRWVGGSEGQSASWRWSMIASQTPGAASDRPDEQSLKSKRGNGRRQPSLPGGHDGAGCAMLDRASREWSLETWLCLHQTVAARHDARSGEEVGLDFGEARARERREKAFKETQPKNTRSRVFEPQKAGPSETARRAAVEGEGGGVRLARSAGGSTAHLQVAHQTVSQSTASLVTLHRWCGRQ